MEGLGWTFKAFKPLFQSRPFRIDVAGEPIGHLQEHFLGRIDQMAGVEFAAKNDVADGRAVAFRRGFHPLRLDRERAAVDDEDRLLDPVGLRKGDISV